MDRTYISHKIILITLLFLSFNAYSLVDYSDDEAPIVKRSKPKAKIKRMNSRMPRKSRPKSNITSNDFELATNYESLSVGNSKVSKIHFRSHFQTNYNFFLDVDYFTIQSDSLDDDIPTTGYERGNPKIMLGLQWFEFGKSEEKVNLDLLVGMSYESTSPHASSRTDKFIGLQTMKRFYNWALGLSYMVRATGTPHDQDEMAVGNITTIGSEIGLMVSSDIQFSLLAQNVKINKSSQDQRDNHLKRKLSFSYVMPKLTLALSPTFSLELGAIFQTDRIKDEKVLLPARLWDIKGAYGNSIFTGINLSI